MKKTFIIPLLLLISTLSAQQIWTVPKQAEVMTNPVMANADNIAKGQKIFKSLCASCHGVSGKGDVVAMQSLNPKPTNFTADAFQHQTDGTIYWKLSEGHGMMASYKSMLSEEQRWQVVNYLRTFKNMKNNTESNTTANAVQQKSISSTKVDAFPFTNLINAKTTHIMQPKGFGLTIQHRFGLTKLDENFITNFMGLDLSANMRFAFEIPVSKKIMVEIGRTRYGTCSISMFVMQKQTRVSFFVVTLEYQNILGAGFRNFVTFFFVCKVEYFSIQFAPILVFFQALQS